LTRVLAEKKRQKKKQKKLSMFRRSTLVSQKRCKIVRRLKSCTVFFVGYVSAQATRLTLYCELTQQRRAAPGVVIKARKYQTSSKE